MPRDRQRVLESCAKISTYRDAVVKLVWCGSLKGQAWKDRWQARSCVVFLSKKRGLESTSTGQGYE